MAEKEKQQSGDDGEPVEDNDLAQDDESEETEEEQEQEQVEKPEKKKETNEERLARELRDTKAALKTANREKRTAVDKLTKIAGNSTDDPEDLATQLANERTARQKTQAQLRKQQVKIAVAEYMALHHKGYEDAISLLPANVLESLEDGDILEDGTYDKDVLTDTIEPLAKLYVENNPRKAQKQERDNTGGVGGEGGRNQAQNNGATSAFDTLSPFPALQQSLRKMAGTPTVGR